MRVLVAYASRHGATVGIAERIADGLTAAGFDAEARDVKEVDDIAPYQAFVVGSAAYMHHWLKEATSFVTRHRAVLSGSPVWLFSSGPVGTDLVDAEGRDIFEVSRPVEFDELKTMVNPRQERVFFGAWDPDAEPVGFAERLAKPFLRLAPKDALPTGDFRDWAAIDQWAAEIAAELRAGDRTLTV
jgi:menaquinone-dependent protoporphyrinogen oxidase